MPPAEFYAVDIDATRSLIANVAQFCADGDAERWTTLVDAVDRETEPLEWGGDLPGAPPEPGSMGALLAAHAIALRAAVLREDGDDGLNGSFCDGLNLLSTLPHKADVAVYNAFERTIFLPHASLPDDIAYLRHPDAYGSYVPNDALGALLAQDDERRYLARVVDALQAKASESTIFIAAARGIESLSDSLRRIHATGHDLVYRELAS